MATAPARGTDRDHGHGFQHRGDDTDLFFVFEVPSLGFHVQTPGTFIFGEGEAIWTPRKQKPGVRY